MIHPSTEVHVILLAGPTLHCRILVVLEKLSLGEMNRATILLLLATTLYCACALEEDAVMGEESVRSDSGGGVGGGELEMLHDYNFMETVKNADFIVVEFYAPW